MTADLLPAVIGYGLFALFVGFLAIKIGALPLLLIIGLVLALCLYDFVRELRGS